MKKAQVIRAKADMGWDPGHWTKSVGYIISTTTQD